MSSFWLPEELQSCVSSPGTVLSVSTTSVALTERTIVSAPPSQSEFSINPSTEENHESTSSLKTSRSRRSFFTSKFKLFKARRTTVSVASDVVKQSSTLTATTERHASLGVQTSQYQSSTLPVKANAPPSPMIGLGLVGLEFDPTNGKYRFKDCSRTLSDGSSYTMDREGSDASHSSCPSPLTPSSVQAAFHGKEQQQRKGSRFSISEAMLGEMLKCRIEEMDRADVAGILGVLCQEDGIAESQTWDAIVHNPATEQTFPSIESPTAISTACISVIASPKDNIPRSRSISIILDHSPKIEEGCGAETMARGRSMITLSKKGNTVVGSRIRNKSHERVKAI